MSILIKGMEIPKNCSVCPMLEGDADDGLCHAANRWLDDDECWIWCVYLDGEIDDSKPLNCPLIEVPTPHGRLKDVDIIIKDECHSCDGCCEVIECDCLNCTKAGCDTIRALNEAPTVIEAEE